MNSSLIAALRPTRRERVIDLVKMTGIDVDKWEREGDKPAASNPNFCYEWAFGDDKDGVFVFNLWHEGLRVDERGLVVYKLNAKQTAEAARGEKHASVRWRRAKKMDELLGRAHRLRAPVRVIINASPEREVTRGRDRVQYRALDSEPWSIETYDEGTGATTLLRGLPTHKFVDQFSVAESVKGGGGRSQRTVDAYNRDPNVRQSALQRANGRCEFCGALGFLTEGGGIYLESHHVVPLSEGGADCTENVAALCPWHHREAHYGISRGEIRLALQRRITSRR